MKIGIIGTRGIPNHYGGFEQFAEYLAIGLIEKSEDVYVYNSHNHPYKQNEWNGIKLIHCYDPEHLIGLAGQFIYDFNCIRDSRKRNFDIILQLGYTSSSIWHKLLPSSTKIVTNMDGMEWQRSKYSKLTRHFLKYAERLAVRSSDLLIADSEAIEDYYVNQYSKPITFIPYGADVIETFYPEQLNKFNILPFQYYLIIARMQEDNHIEEIIKGIIASGSSFPILVVGNVSNTYGKYLKGKYESERVLFLGSIFDKNQLDQLRHFTKLYFHGHSAGGTNPSLLEAMAATALICAHNNQFNRSVLGDDAFYFTDHHDIAKLINGTEMSENTEQLKNKNLEKIKIKYTWRKIICDYHHSFINILKKGSTV